MQQTENNENITVSICCLAFNHEDFIAQTLDGFLLQRTNFDFEIIVHDDCSTDGTRQIIESYQKKYPNIVKPIFQLQNQYSLGLKPIFNHVFPKAVGKYIALCEGDDYWTDPLKLQKQVDYLNVHVEAVQCFHPVQILMPDGLLREDFLTKVPDNYQRIEVIAAQGNFLHTPSVMFRNVIRQFPEMIHETPIGDYFLQMLLATHGEFHQLPDVMAVYRYGVGVWSNEQQFTRSLRTAKTHALLMTYFTQNDNHPVAEIFARRIAGFMERFPHEMEKKHIEYLITNSEIAVPVMQAMNRELKKRNDAVERLRTNQLQTSSIKKMVTELSRRMIHKLRGNK
jgi:glycosyltransferase involved in cell wall biosynthesis